MVVEGEKVVTRSTLAGTHIGEFMVYPPTTKKVTVWAFCITCIVGGKIVESWIMWDALGMM